jgi:hypothetical protein
VIDRSDLLSFFENISEFHIRELFSIINEIKNVIEYESESEKRTYEMFCTLLWRVTDGADMVLDGKNRPLAEELDECE